MMVRVVVAVVIVIIFGADFKAKEVEDNNGRDGQMMLRPSAA